MPERDLLERLESRYINKKDRYGDGKSKKPTVTRKGVVETPTPNQIQIYINNQKNGGK